MHTAVLESIDAVPAAEWNRLAGTANPFVRHEFLAALEHNGCLGDRWGWWPRHLAVHDGAGRLVGACPLYLKNNSYGEFVFDWAWADAYQRHGRRYYPKLVSCVPYSPVTGPRLLCDPAADRGAVLGALTAAALALAEDEGASGTHWLFTDAQATGDLVDLGFMRRVGVQYHWHNPGYRDFDDFLSTLTSRRRKDIRRERRLARDTGAEMEILDGHSATAQHWDVYHRCYQATFHRKWGYATLSEGFFREVADTMPDSVVLVMVRHEGEYVAGAFNLAGDDALFGRHWGTLKPLDYVHFEACYYQAIDEAIRRGLGRFEAGAQGEHKIQRGFLPRTTYSAHHLRDPDFADAVARFLDQEERHMSAVVAELEAGSPYRQPD